MVQPRKQQRSQWRSRVVVVGLGPGKPEWVTREAWQRLRRAGRLVLRTERHEMAAVLRSRGIAFETFDPLYERIPSYDDLYRAMAQRLVSMAAEGPVVYGVPGHPTVGEASVQELLRQAAAAGVPVELVPGVSAVEAALAALGLDPLEVKLGYLDGQTLTGPEAAAHLDPARAWMVLQVDSRLTAAGVKLALAEVFGDEYPVHVVQGAGGSRARIEALAVSELDRWPHYDDETLVYVPARAAHASTLPSAGDGSGSWMERLVQVMARLRNPDGGCPWDRQQTHESLRRYLIEEAYEVCDAIERGRLGQDLQEELGDLLLQVLFHAQLAAEAGRFDMADVEQTLHDKLIRRHPHVFGEGRAQDAAEVLRNWEAIKAQERAAHGESEAGQAGGAAGAGAATGAVGGGASAGGANGVGEPGILDGVVAALPALRYAEAVQRRVARVGFEWPDLAGAGRKAVEETRELRRAWEGGQPQRIYEEFGDLLFALVNVSRYMKVDAELALRDATRRFVVRFQEMEAQARAEGRRLADMSLEAMDELWEAAKRCLGPES